ncbi:tRNA glutamyl-Q(34) synthetase GluQRS [Methylocystis sp. MJC1]|jgi:glutamyl-Q tRNA(Asp) synthetase|uniref:tRNA glutamyl-Q(34) synthetase GluQRS n=1 Tax=Methylocystis sp. MJC1 TaxID=2654282 RepID=UPI0013ECD065|nr:tRNA glutamyl-Q(34) synthetase GluQRS [Methylocystis sp. MJC1]KAF2989068.1 Glutamate--tRNA ligase [Methylocystis sp. MJC1]MBU6527873.1 tRNA glutamyl-Q(34) synthetase GluQRS [Methylocystis sp. MJC1]UZX10794.1 tRNA glutamyl-Q(34) synthetase GluQRS [Methylocystis sp. MJC1]
MSERRIFRFAPSPNGYLHLGHAYSALLNFTLARGCGGRFLLRIEDIDLGRVRPAFEAAIYEDLAWLGLEWEKPVRRQSEHFDDYAAALERLDAMGLLYACGCKRSDIGHFAAEHPGWPRDPDGAPLYSGICREKPRRPAREILADGGEALRLDMAKATALAGEGLFWREYCVRGREGAPDAGEGFFLTPANPAQWGDVVLARKDTPASYHIAVVVDDALQGVSDIVRGRDLFFATSLHRLLQRLLSLPEPRYRHHELVLDDTGEKLAKSRGSTTLRALREAGISAAEVWRKLGFQISAE